VKSTYSRKFQNVRFSRLTGNAYLGKVLTLPMMKIWTGKPLRTLAVVLLSTSAFPVAEVNVLISARYLFAHEQFAGCRG
jgi:hypothetical protein